MCAVCGALKMFFFLFAVYEEKNREKERGDVITRWQQKFIHFVCECVFIQHFFFPLRPFHMQISIIFLWNKFVALSNI